MFSVPRKKNIAHKKNFIFGRKKSLSSNSFLRAGFYVPLHCSLIVLFINLC